MYAGTLIEDLFAVVGRAEDFARRLNDETPRTQPAEAHASRAERPSDVCQCKKGNSEPEQLAESLGLSPADRDLGLLLVIHAQLVRAFEPGNDFADTVDIHQVGAMSPPE